MNQFIYSLFGLRHKVTQNHSYPVIHYGPVWFGLVLLKFNSHHINVPSNVWSTKCRLIACMSVQIMSNLQDESIKPN
jgi:hypothetical protein